MATLEEKARALWQVWAEYQQHGICDCCGRPAYVGRNKRRVAGRIARWLCVDCWDQGERS